MRGLVKKFFVFLSLPALLACSAFLACGPEENNLQYSKLVRFQSCEELKKYLGEVALQTAEQSQFSNGNPRVMAAGSSGFFGWGSPAPAMESLGGNDSAPTQKKTSGGPSSGSPESGTPDHSTTNVQVKGVDEADFVKNDGKHIYVVTKEHFLIIKAWPTREIKELARYKLPERAQEMYVYQDRVILFSQPGGDYQPTHLKAQVSGRSLHSKLTRITILGIEDKTRPELLREMVLEGEYKTSRRIGQMVRVVLYSYLRGPDIKPIPSSSKRAPRGNASAGLANLEADKVRNENRKKVEQSSLADWLPKYQDITYKNKAPLQKSVQMLCDCSRFYKPTVLAGRGIISVASIDLSAPTKTIQDSALVSDYGHVYSSATGLYVATRPYYRPNSYEGRSYLHKFDVSQKGEPAHYKGSGAVPGWILNQFAMDEHNGYLRVATTTEGGSSKNNVFVLEEKDSKLEVVGELRGLAPGEKIYSARFMGERGFIVTFRQVDPLFTLDLRDPQAPRVVGKLKIPGFSTYIHPLGKDHLLTIGLDGGVQLAIFDVSQFDQPKQLHKIIIKNTWSNGSEALYNHKAFNYYEKKKMLAIPVSSPSSYSSSFRSELRLYNIDVVGGISLHGSVNHSDFFKNVNPYNSPQQYPFQGQVRRGIFIDDYIYSISEGGMKVNELAKLSNELAKLLFP